MQTVNIEVDRERAAQLYRDYKAHAQYEDGMDAEIRRAYQLIAQGKQLIDLKASIKAAGLGADGLPKMAVARAIATHCFLRLCPDGSAEFKNVRWARYPHEHIKFTSGSFVGAKYREAQAIMPLIPVSLRPRKALREYHVLWEAIWTPMPPIDPLLIRRIGRSNMWVVVAAWDLTEVERAAMASRMEV